MGDISFPVCADSELVLEELFGAVEGQSKVPLPNSYQDVLETLFQGEQAEQEVEVMEVEPSAERASPSVSVEAFPPAGFFEAQSPPMVPNVVPPLVPPVSQAQVSPSLQDGSSSTVPIIGSPGSAKGSGSVSGNQSGRVSLKGEASLFC